MHRYINKFVSYLEIEKNYSPHTILNYQIDIEECIKFAEGKAVEEIDYLLLRRFLAFLRSREYRPRTLARKLSALRSFFKFLQREGHIKDNPASLVQTPKLDKTLPKFLSEDEITAFIEAPDIKTEVGKRDKAVLETI